MKKFPILQQGTGGPKQDQETWTRPARQTTAPQMRSKVQVNRDYIRIIVGIPRAWDEKGLNRDVWGSISAYAYLCGKHRGMEKHMEAIVLFRGQVR